MLEPEPYYTFWKVAEKWAPELKCCIMEVIQLMRRHATYPDASLIVWPTEFFSSKGIINESSVLKATGRVNAKRTRYYTPEFVVAKEFLNSAEWPPQVTEEITSKLSLFAIRRDDFKQFCESKNIPLPVFWFPEEKSSVEHQEQSTGPTLPKEKRKGRSYDELSLLIYAIQERNYRENGSFYTNNVLMRKLDLEVGKGVVERVDKKQVVCCSGMKVSIDQVQKRQTPIRAEIREKIRKEKTEKIPVK